MRGACPVVAVDGETVHCRLPQGACLRGWPALATGTSSYVGAFPARSPLGRLPAFGVFGYLAVQYDSQRRAPSEAGAARGIRCWPCAEGQRWAESAG